MQDKLLEICSEYGLNLGELAELVLQWSNLPENKKQCNELIKFIENKMCLE